MGEAGCEAGRDGLVSQLLEGEAAWQRREATFDRLAAEAARLDRDGDGASLELQSLILALTTAAALARSCRLACAAVLPLVR